VLRRNFLEPQFSEECNEALLKNVFLSPLLKELVVGHNIGLEPLPCEFLECLLLLEVTCHIFYRLATGELLPQHSFIISPSLLRVVRTSFSISLAVDTEINPIRPFDFSYTHNFIGRSVPHADSPDTRGCRALGTGHCLLP